MGYANLPNSKAQAMRAPVQVKYLDRSQGQGSSTSHPPGSPKCRRAAKGEGHRGDTGFRVQGTMENQIEQKMESEVKAGVGMISNIVGPLFFFAVTA